MEQSSLFGGTTDPATGGKVDFETRRLQEEIIASRPATPERTFESREAKLAWLKAGATTGVVPKDQ